MLLLLENLLIYNIVSIAQYSILYWYYFLLQAELQKLYDAEHGRLDAEMKASNSATTGDKDAQP